MRNTLRGRGRCIRGSRRAGGRRDGLQARAGCAVVLLKALQKQCTRVATGRQHPIYIRRKRGRLLWKARREVE